MESLHLSDLHAVSRYWTPDHLDVTHVPMTYASPKRTWIDGYAEHRRRAKRVDARDRLVRRRINAGSVVEAADIAAAPVFAAPPPVKPRLDLLAGLRSTFGRVAARRPGLELEGPGTEAFPA